MPDEQAGQVKVGYLQALPERDRKAAHALHEQIRAQVREEIANSVDPATRPTFSMKAPDGDEFGQRFARFTPEVKSDLTGATLQHKSGGFLPPMELTTHERVEAVKSAVEGGFNINWFPRGDIDNFSVCRWAMANERANNTSEGGTAFQKHAPWEAQYYSACEKLALSNKAMGDMVSGSIPGRAA